MEIVQRRTEVDRVPGKADQNGDAGGEDYILDLASGLELLRQDQAAERWEDDDAGSGHLRQRGESDAEAAEQCPFAPLKAVRDDRSEYRECYQENHQGVDQGGAAQPIDERARSREDRGRQSGALAV